MERQFDIRITPVFHAGKMPSDSYRGPEQEVIITDRKTGAVLFDRITQTLSLNINGLNITYPPK